MSCLLYGLPGPGRPGVSMKILNSEADGGDGGAAACSAALEHTGMIYSEGTAAGEGASERCVDRVRV